MTDSIFEKNLVLAQSELYKFAIKLTANNEEADDLLQET